MYILGAFLIPFFVMLILEGVPLFLIELGLGQRMRQGALGVWNTIHPWLGGIGIASCIVTFFVALYYNVIITWCFYYLFNSLRVSESIKLVTSIGTAVYAVNGVAMLLWVRISNQSHRLRLHGISEASTRY